jgi:hypothetical protein
MLPLRLALLAVTCLHIAHATTWGKESLKGLTAFSVSVVVESPCKQIIVADRIQTDVELKLRSAGLSLKQDVQREVGGAALDVSVGCVPVIKGGRTVAWAIAFTLSVMQGVDLRTAKTPVLAQTWGVDGTLDDSVSSVESHTRSWIRDGVDEFLNDYLSVNPKN